MTSMRGRMTLVLAGILIGACGITPKASAPIGTSNASSLELARKKIKHVVIIMQENRSFDSYFGTFPGADGIPTKDGKFTVCAPDPVRGTCVAPFHDPTDLNHGGPHGEGPAREVVNGGKMDGFIAVTYKAQYNCEGTANPDCGGEDHTQVMGYHDARELPNYWALAENFVLQDHMFEPNASWSLPQHLFMVSGWSARCETPGDPMSCVNSLGDPGMPPDYPGYENQPPVHYAWTDMTYLFHKNNVSWRYYVQAGGQTDCGDDADDCIPLHADSKTPGIWSPLPYFDTVTENGQLENIADVLDFYRAAASGDLPAVSWIAPSLPNSEHPPALVSDGQTWTASLINAIMQGPEWESTVIFLSWDD